VTAEVILRRRSEVSSAAPLACSSTPCYILTAMKPLLCFSDSVNELSFAQNIDGLR